MSTINVDTTVTTVNVITTGQQGPGGPQGPIGPTGEVDPVVIAYLQGLIDGLNESKLDKIDYVQHFRGLHNSYADLVTSIPMGNDGDYAHIKASQNFPRLEAIWSGTPGVWNITSANIGINTDAVPEGGTNLYFTSSRAQQAALLALLTGLDTSNATPVLPTDTIKQAIGKLQAQHAPAWVNIETFASVVFNSNVRRDRTRIELAKINGVLWIRGYYSRGAGNIVAGAIVFSHNEQAYLCNVTTADGIEIDGLIAACLFVYTATAGANTHTFRQTTQITNMGLSMWNGSTNIADSSAYVVISPTPIGRAK